MRRAPLADRLLLWLFGAARRIFLLQGLAFGCAWGAALAWTATTTAAPWITRALWSGGLLSGIFVVAGLLLWRMRSWPPAVADPAMAIGWPWRTALAMSFVLMAGVTLIASEPLPVLWRQILAQLTAIEFWDGLENPGQFGGIVILPIVLALAVPALVTIAASFSFVFPLLLLARLRQRPSMFPVLLAMGAVCDAALVGSGWFAMRLFTDLGEAASTAMAKAPDADVVALATQLTSAIDTLTKTATALIVPAAALVVWAVFLRPLGRAAAAFGEPIDDAPELPNLAGSYKEEPFVTFSAEAGDAPASSSRMASYARWGLAGLGVLMLLFWMTDSLRSRAAFVASTPPPAASVAASPPAIRVTFDHALDEASTLSLVYLPVVASENDIARDIRVTSRLAADDRTRRTIEAIPPRLRNGLYLVRWTAHPSSGGGVIRHGSFAFGVRTAVPRDSADRTMSLTERDSGGRGRRSTALGGAILLVLAVLVSYRAALGGQ
jgi:methionine-rich copper-binding protein CopC